MPMGTFSCSFVHALLWLLAHAFRQSFLTCAISMFFSLGRRAHCSFAEHECVNGIKVYAKKSCSATGTGMLSNNVLYHRVGSLAEHFTQYSDLSADAYKVATHYASITTSIQCVVPSQYVDLHHHNCAGILGSVG